MENGKSNEPNDSIKDKKKLNRRMLLPLIHGLIFQKSFLLYSIGDPESACHFGEREENGKILPNLSLSWESSPSSYFQAPSHT